jgi:hypothetical protein
MSVSRILQRKYIPQNETKRNFKLNFIFKVAVKLLDKPKRGGSPEILFFGQISLGGLGPRFQFFLSFNFFLSSIFFFHFIQKKKKEVKAQALTSKLFKQQQQQLF